MGKKLYFLCLQTQSDVLNNILKRVFKFLERKHVELKITLFRYAYFPWFLKVLAFRDVLASYCLDVNQTHVKRGFLIVWCIMDFRDIWNTLSANKFKYRSIPRPSKNFYFFINITILTYEELQVAQFPIVWLTHPLTHFQCLPVRYITPCQTTSKSAI